MKEDCYFWIDESKPEDERCLTIFCKECYEKENKKCCWFWEGSKKGYGPFNFTCDKCNKIISKKNQ